MSIQDAKNFVNDLHNDDALRKTVSLDSGDIVTAATAKGYTVTPAEMKTAIADYWTATPASKVLSEAPGF